MLYVNLSDLTQSAILFHIVRLVGTPAAWIQDGKMALSILLFPKNHKGREMRYHNVNRTKALQYFDSLFWKILRTFYNSCYFFSPTFSWLETWKRYLMANS